MRKLTIRVVLFLVLAVARLSAQGTDTVIGFEDLAANTVVSNQYSNQGVVFGLPGFLPYAVKVGPGLAQSGTTVLNISCGPVCSDEFPIPAVAGTFLGGPRKRVKVFVGAFPGTIGTALVALTARDALGNIVAQSPPVVLTPGAGFHTPLSVEAANPTIASFELQARAGLDIGKQLGIDDLTFDNPSGSQPDFGLQAYAVTLVAGAPPVDVPITIFRLNGSSGDIAFFVSNLPAGVTSQFLPNPTTGTSVIMRLTAQPGAPRSVTAATILGFPGNLATGPSGRVVIINVAVVSGLEVVGPSSIDLSGCTNSVAGQGTVQVPLEVVRQVGVNGPVTLTVNGLPSQVTGSLSASTLNFPAGALGDNSILTLTAAAGVNVPDTFVQIGATNGVVNATLVFSVHGTCPRQNKDFTIRGSFSCESVWGLVKPISHAQVEFFRYRSGPFDDWVGATKTNDDGSFSQYLHASIEGDYYARLRLDDKAGVHLNDNWTTSIWSIDTPHVSNRQPIIDFGNEFISRDNGYGTPKCAVWQAARTAYQEYVDKVTGGFLPPDADYSLVVWKGALAPWSSLATTNWPDDYPTGMPGPSWEPNGDTINGVPFHDDMTSIHEFGHTIRHSVDGDVLHWTNDARIYDYARKHDFCFFSNDGFAFNEGWAEYWSKEPDIRVNGGEPHFANSCPGAFESARHLVAIFGLDPNGVTPSQFEGIVARDLMLLEQCTGVGRKGMFAVLQRGQNIVHSDQDFRNRFHEQFPTIDLSRCPNPEITGTVVAPPSGSRNSSSMGLVTTGSALPSEFRSHNFFARVRTLLLNLLHKQRPITTESQMVAIQAEVDAQNKITNQLKTELVNALKIASNPGTCPATPCDIVAQRVVKPSILQGEISLSEQLQRQLEADLASTRRGERSKPLFSSDTERLVNALKFDQETKEIVLRALRAAISSLAPLAAQDKSSALAVQSAELQSQEKLLQLRTTSDEISSTFLKLPRSYRDEVVGNSVLHPYMGLLAKDYVVVWAFLLLVALILAIGLLAWLRIRRMRPQTP